MSTARNRTSGPARRFRGPPSRLSHRQAAARAAPGATVRLIYTHDNPDPDSLAAALSLARSVRARAGARVTSPTAGSWAAPKTAPWSTGWIQLTPIEQLDPSAYDLRGAGGQPAGHREQLAAARPPRRRGGRSPPAAAGQPLGALVRHPPRSRRHLDDHLRVPAGAAGAHRRGARHRLLLRAAHRDARPRPRGHRGRAARLPGGGAARRPRAAVQDDPPQGAARPLRGAGSRAALGRGVRRRSSPSTSTPSTTPIWSRRSPTSCCPTRAPSWCCAPAATTAPPTCRCATSPPSAAPAA